LRRIASGRAEARRNEGEKTQTAPRDAAPLSCWHVT